VQGLLEGLRQRHDPSTVDRYIAADLYQHDPVLPMGPPPCGGHTRPIEPSTPNSMVSSVQVVAQDDYVTIRLPLPAHSNGPWQSRPPRHSGARRQDRRALDHLAGRPGSIREHEHHVLSKARGSAGTVRLRIVRRSVVRREALFVRMEVKDRP